MATTLKYGKQNAMCWFLISPDNIRMLITKWMNRIVNFWMGDIFSFVVCLVCGPLLVPGMFGSSGTDALTGGSPLIAVMGGVVVAGYQVGCGGIGVEVAEESGKVDELGTRDKNIKIWKHFLGLIIFPNFRVNCPAAGPRYGSRSHVIMGVFDSISAGSQLNQVDVQSVTVVIVGSLLDMDAQFRGEVLSVVRPWGCGLKVV